MSRALLACIAVVALGAFGTACPDPCVWLGNGCNANGDCEGDEVCRVSREFEYVCPVVKGVCVTPTGEGIACGSVDDCEDGECCDPESNTCIGALGYRSVKCDDATCGDCDETDFGDYCVDDGDCSDAESCDGVEFLFDDESRGICRPRCNNDEECASIERCNSSTCSAPIGTPCRKPDVSSSDECLGLDCTDRDINDGRVDQPYCTGFCSTVDDIDVCPANMRCDEDTLRCRLL